MKISRRDFVKTTMVGAAGLYAGAYAIGARGAESAAMLPEEDGYKLWLRYAPPGSVAKKYQTSVRQVCVEGDSPTAKIIREELRFAATALLGNAVPADGKAPGAGAVVVGTPANSQLIRN